MHRIESACEDQPTPASTPGSSDEEPPGGRRRNPAVSETMTASSYGALGANGYAHCALHQQVVAGPWNRAVLPQVLPRTGFDRAFPRSNCDQPMLFDEPGRGRHPEHPARAGA